MKFVLNINQTPLLLALRGNNTQIIKLLLSREDINVNDKFIFIQ